MRLICLGDLAVSGSLAPITPWPRPLSGLNGREAACVLFNWEFPCAERCLSSPRPSGSRRRSVAPLEAVELVREWAPAVAALANNHLLDGGAAGVVQTINALERAGISTVGGGTSVQSISKPWVWGGEAGKVAIINWVTPETHPEAPDLSGGGPNLWPGEKAAGNQITHLRKIVDWIVVYIHWSDELFSYPRPADRTLARKLLEWGADAVVGNHSHVVRGFEEIDGRPIFYGLGNYFFGNVGATSGGRLGKQVSRNREALVVELQFRRGQKLSWRVHSYWRDEFATRPDGRRRAAVRLLKTSQPLKMPDYGTWYYGARLRFDRWEKRLHFRVPAMGWRGMAQWLTQKSIQLLR